MLPEYKGWNAATVHEEPGDLFDAITARDQALGLNIVHDATMKTAKKAVGTVQRFKDAGYRTEAHYMYLPPQQAAKHAVGRFPGPTKRFVPPGVVLGNITNETAPTGSRAWLTLGASGTITLARVPNPVRHRRSRMKLTDENQDYMDCRPPRETGIKLSQRIEETVVKRKAEREAATSPKGSALPQAAK